MINATPITTHYHHCDDTHYDTLLRRHPLHITKEIDLAPRARLNWVTYNRHLITATLPLKIVRGTSRVKVTFCHRRLRPATNIRCLRGAAGCPQGPQVHLLGVYEVSGQPIIGCVPRDPKDFAKLLKWNSSISFPRQESDCQIVNGSH